MGRVGDFILLDLLMLLCSLPVITIGPALSAIYYVGLKEVKDEEGYLWRSFWKAFKQNFKKGAILELIVVAAIAMLWFDISVAYNWAYAEGSFPARLLMFALLGFLIVVIATIIYLFPMLAKFDNTIIKMIKNSMMMSSKHLPQTIVMLLATGVLIYATVAFPPFIIFSIGFSTYINSYILARIFDLYIPKTEEKDPDDFTFNYEKEEKQE